MVTAESLKSEITVLLLILYGSSTGHFSETEVALAAMPRIVDIVDDSELNADTVGLKCDWK